MTVIVAGALAEPEAAADPDPQYARHHQTAHQYYQKATQAYPEQSYQPAQYESYSKPAYPAYCDSRTAPKCLKNKNQSFCLTDIDYPENEIQVIITNQLI